MKVSFRESFQKDLAKARDSFLAKQIHKLIMRVESAKSLAEIPSIKKLAGSNGFFRIRIGDYRVGIIIEGNSVEFVRVLHRRDIYRYFP